TCASPPEGNGDPNPDETSGRTRAPCQAASSNLPSTASGPEIDGIVRNTGSAAKVPATHRKSAPKHLVNMAGRLTGHRPGAGCVRSSRGRSNATAGTGLADCE